MAIAELDRIAELASVRGIELSELADVLEGLPERPHGRLAAAEQDVLAALGVGPVEEAPTRPVMAGVLRRRQLENAALTTGQVAELLDRDPSRIRQRLDGPRRSLLGFHRQSVLREWLLPAFQFELGVHDQPGWAALLQALPQTDETSPTALVAWLTSPSTHLGGRSRAQALADGFDPQMLVAEATTFGMPA
ncbi:MAG: hypothetical protein WEB03_16145 [Nitriliruptor sp.]|uniref:hypothetical protein n=1 Tax=Nitriliruptor sp. TaxID=2448056 RepID=UPI0034A0A845